MFALRSLLYGVIRARSILTKFPNVPTTVSAQRRAFHDDGPPQPFDNMPFSIPNRFAATLFFAVFFGIGFWAPFVIVWYSMAKKTL